MAFVFDITATTTAWGDVLSARAAQASAQSDYDAQYAVKPTPPQDVTSSPAWNDYTDDLNSWQSSVNAYKATLDTAKNTTAAAETACIATLFSSDSAPADWCFDQWIDVAQSTTVMATSHIIDGGTGYVVGNTLNIIASTTGHLVVDTVDGSGVILTYHVTTPAHGVNAGSICVLAGGSGADAALYIDTVVVNPYWIGVARDAYQIVESTVLPTQPFPNL